MTLFMIRVCGCAAASADCRPTERRDVMWVAIPAMIISGIATATTVEWIPPRAVELVGRHRDVRRKGSAAEQLRVDEGLHVGGVEEVVLGLARLELAQHVEQREEDRCLDQRGQAAGQRVDAGFLVELHQLFALALPVVLVLLADLAHLRLQFLHPQRRVHLLHEGLEQDRAQGEHQEHHRQHPGPGVVGAEEQPEHLVPDPQNPGDRVVDVVQREEVEAHSVPFPGRTRSEPVAAPSVRGGTGSQPPSCHG